MIRERREMPDSVSGEILTGRCAGEDSGARRLCFENKIMEIGEGFI